MSIGVIIADHRHSHGIGIPLIEVAGKLHIFHISVLSLLRLIDESQKLCLCGCKSGSRVGQIPLGLPAIGKHHQSSGSFPGKHRQRPGDGVLKIGGCLVRQGHDSGKVILLCEKLLYHGVFAKGHNAVLILFRHFSNRLIQVIFHGGQILTVAVGNIHQKNGGIQITAPGNPHSCQRQEKHNDNRRTHCQIKPVTLSHLFYIQKPFCRQQDQSRRQQNISQMLFYKTISSGNAIIPSLGCDPSVGLTVCGKTDHVGFAFVPGLCLIQSCLAGLGRKRLCIQIRLRMKDHRVPRLIYVFRQKRGLAQKAEGIGYKNGKFRLQGKIRFPDIKAHHHRPDSILITVVAGALIPCP